MNKEFKNITIAVFYRSSRASMLMLAFLLSILPVTGRSESLLQCDFSKSFKVELNKDSPIGAASIREHTIVWHAQKKKYYLLADVIPLNWKLHPNTYDTEIHLFSSPDLSEWKYHGVAIEKGKTEDAYDKFGVASPVAAAVVDGIIYCPYSARRTSEYTGRSVGLAYSFADPEKIPWNKTQRPISDLPGEDDDTAMVKDDKTDLFHLYHRTAIFHSKGGDYHIVHSQSAKLYDEAFGAKFSLAIRS